MESKVLTQNSDRDPTIGEINSGSVESRKG